MPIAPLHCTGLIYQPPSTLRSPFLAKYSNSRWCPWLLVVPFDHFRPQLEEQPRSYFVVIATVEMEGYYILTNSTLKIPVMYLMFRGIA